MEQASTLEIIRRELFHGAADYTKSLPDLYIPHRFRLIAPSQAGRFLEELRASLVEEEILVYLHFPFCFSECRFCNSFPHKVNREVQDRYVQSLVKEISLFFDAGVFAGKRARCVYLGGGTPTSFSMDDIRLVLGTLRSCIELTDDITCEAHPSTLENGRRIQAMVDAGINRISVGCQTFDPAVLEHCNRTHTATQVKKIIDTAREAGARTNIDMMTGLPGQSLSSVEGDLEILDRIRPDAIEYIRHEIVNPLVIALFKSHPELVVGDDELFEMVYRTQSWLEERGYEQNGRYTTGRQWEYRYHWLEEMPIIAFGSRARSYTKTMCYDKHEDLPTYFSAIEKGIPPAIRQINLTKREQMYRSLLLRLQIRKGVKIRTFQDRFGEDPRIALARVVKDLEGLGCLEEADGALRLTRYGSYFVEDICDLIVDAALKEESKDLGRAPHSEGNTSSRLSLG
ncbi:MAG: radical SAM protein [Planctomycetota bacterium]